MVACSYSKGLIVEVCGGMGGVSWDEVRSAELIFVDNVQVGLMFPVLTFVRLGSLRADRSIV